jgi:hypothetical protein
MRTPRYRNLNSLAGIGGAGERKCDARSTLIPGDPGVKLLNEAQALRARPGNQRLTALPKEAAEVGLWKAELESLINELRFPLRGKSASGGCAMLFRSRSPDILHPPDLFCQPHRGRRHPLLSDAWSTEGALNHYAKTPGSVARKSAYRQFPPSGSTF